MSFGSIGAIIRKLTGEENNNKKGEGEQPKIELSKEAQAFKLFSERKTSVDVVIQLDIKPEEAETLYLEFLRLSHLDKLVLMYKESELDVQLLLNLFRIIKLKGMNEQDILNVLKYVKEMPYLEDMYERLLKDVDELDHRKCKLREELLFLQNEMTKLRNALKWYKSELALRAKEVSELNLKKR